MNAGGVSGTCWAAAPALAGRAASPQRSGARCATGCVVARVNSSKRAAALPHQELRVQERQDARLIDGCIGRLAGFCCTGRCQLLLHGSFASCTGRSMGCGLLLHGSLPGLLLHGSLPRLSGYCCTGRYPPGRLLALDSEDVVEVVLCLFAGRESTTSNSPTFALAVTPQSCRHEQRCTECAARARALGFREHGRTFAAAGFLVCLVAAVFTGVVFVPFRMRLGCSFPAGECFTVVAAFFTPPAFPLGVGALGILHASASASGQV